MESSLEISFDSASSSDHALLTWALPLDAVQVDTFISNRLPKTAVDKWKSHVVPRLYSLFTRGGDIHDSIPQVDDSLLPFSEGQEGVMGFHPYVEYLPLGDTESLDRAVELLHACCIGAMQDISPPGKRPAGFCSAP